MRNAKRIVLFLLCASMLFLAGCKGKTTKIILHTGFSHDEVFRIEHMNCTLPELMMYLSATQSRYENVYGKQIWETNLEGVTLEENMKEINDIVQEYLAKELGIQNKELGENEIVEVITQYFMKQNDKDISKVAQ